MSAWRFIPVVLMLGASAALLTDRTKLPLALRGLRRVTGGGAPAASAVHRVSPARRVAAFVLILAAFLIAAFG